MENCSASQVTRLYVAFVSILGQNISEAAVHAKKRWHTRKNRPADQNWRGTVLFNIRYNNFRGNKYFSVSIEDNQGGLIANVQYSNHNVIQKDRKRTGARR
jgi:hypothetical protein